MNGPTLHCFHGRFMPALLRRPSQAPWSRWSANGTKTCFTDLLKRRIRAPFVEFRETLWFLVSWTYLSPSPSWINFGWILEYDNIGHPRLLVSIWWGASLIHDRVGGGLFSPPLRVFANSRKTAARSAAVFSIPVSTSFSRISWKF